MLPVATIPLTPPTTAFLVESAIAYVPYANDVPLMLGLGMQLARIHEIWARVGYMPTGDDVDLWFGVLGYRAVLRPRRFVRPFVGGFVAELPQTCTHDARGEPSCTPTHLFILSATAGVRFEPSPWFGVSVGLSTGIDSYPNPFGMVELGATFALPLP